MKTFEFNEKKLPEIELRSQTESFIRNNGI